MPVSLLSETPEWIVVAKPAGWLSVPGREPAVGDGQPRPVLSEWVAGKFGAVLTVHRLDVETSGVILFARTPEAHRKASLWFQGRKTRKTYDFLASGQASIPMFRIRRPIEGSPSATQVEVGEPYREAFLGRAVPLTGRRHQIRIHLSHEGFPLWGDPAYGGPRQIEKPLLRVERVALHARRLELPSGEAFEAPWPEDFSRWVQVLRQEGTRLA